MAKDKKKPVVDWAERLAALQKSLGETNVRMAQRMGVSNNTYQQWKYRQRPIPVIAQKLIEQLEQHAS